VIRFALALYACALLALSSALSAGAQNDKPQEDKPAPEQHDQAPQKRPTLGPPTESSPGGPHSSTTTDSRKLIRVHKIYLENMDNHLSDKLMEDLAKSGRFQIAADAKDADAVMRGTCFDSRRLRSLHSEVFLSDRASGSTIWQDSILRPLNPPALAKAVDDTALLIAQHLTGDVQEALRK